MRRYLLVPMLALALVVGACGTNTAKEPRTLTEIVTVTGTSPAPTGSAGADGSAGITVVGPSGNGSSSGSAGSSTGPATGSAAGGSGSTDSTQSGESSPTGKSGTSSAAPSTSKAATTKKTPHKPTGKAVKVDPLHVSCSLLLDRNDIKDALGKTVSSSSDRIVDVPNPDVKMTGKTKCYFGGKSKAKNRPVTVALAQYKSPKAAQNQLDVTAKSEVSLGAESSTVKVSGHPARVLLRDGGLLVMRYSDWTLSIAVEHKLVAPSKLPKGMQDLARMVLARVLKHG